MKGKRGCCGKPGPAGPNGKKGERGYDGRDGCIGPSGPQGPPGPYGDQGDKGNDGFPGLPGSPGQKGDPGERGPRGPECEGKQGIKGEKGKPSNTVGLPGLNGYPGDKGEKGNDGENGTSGIQGPRGRQGPTGPIGPQGPPGNISIPNLRIIISNIIRELIPGDCLASDCKSLTIDVVFLIDGSDSVTDNDFKKVKEWILQTVDAFLKSSTKTPLFVSVVQFSNNVNVELEKFVYYTSNEILQNVSAIKRMHAGTNTYKALDFVNGKVYPKLRNDSLKILIIVTDGDATDVKNVAVISKSHSIFNKTVVVGVGNNINKTRLQDLSSTGKTFDVNNFSELAGIYSDLVTKICSHTEKPPTCEDEQKISIEESRPSSILNRSQRNYFHAVADVAFVLDVSASVGESGIAKLSYFLTDIVNNFLNVKKEGVRFSLIQYSEHPSLEFAFNDTDSRNDIQCAIMNITYLGGMTKTGAALWFLEETLINSKRPNVKQIAILFTDGRSLDDVDHPAASLKERGVILFVVGIGEAEPIELNLIASEPKSKHILEVENYAMLNEITGDLTQKLYEELDES